jgi:hypothetical protein
MKLLDFIVCDDIRNEVGNKHTLVGVYGDTIRISAQNPNKFQWPYAMRIAFFVRLLLEGPHDRPDKLYFGCFYGDQEIFKVDGSVSPPNKNVNVRTLNINTIVDKLLLRGPGEVIPKLRLYKEGKEIFSWISENPIVFSVVEATTPRQ